MGALPLASVEPAILGSWLCHLCHLSQLPEDLCRALATKAKEHSDHPVFSRGGGCCGISMLLQVEMEFLRAVK